MRILPIVAVLAGVLLAPSLAAQEAASPLPALLVPAWEVEAAAQDRAMVGGVTGLLVGMTVGGLYGAFLAEECTGEEGGCDLSREMKSMVYGVIGGGLGGLIGLGTSFVLGDGAAPSAASAPIALAPTPDGGLRVGMTLRH
jgi:hypothetical protein